MVPVMPTDHCASTNSIKLAHKGRPYYLYPECAINNYSTNVSSFNLSLKDGGKKTLRTYTLMECVSWAIEVNMLLIWGRETTEDSKSQKIQASSSELPFVSTAHGHSSSEANNIMTP